MTGAARADGPDLAEPAPAAGGRCFVHRCQLRWADFDAYRHMNNVRFLELFQDARIEFANTVLPDPRGLEAATVVARQEIDYLVPIGYRPGTVDVAIRVTRIGRSSATVAFDVRDSVGDAGLQPAGHLADGGGRAGGGPDRAGVTRYATGSCVVVAYDLAARASRRFTTDERAVFAVIAEPSRS